MSNVIPTGRFGKVCVATIPMGIGQRFKELRDALYFTRDNMAWKVGLTTATLKHYELGTRKTNLDGLLRFVRVWKEERREEILGWLLYGGVIPQVGLLDTINGAGENPGSSDVSFAKTPNGIQIACRVRHVREEVFNLGREEFVEKIKSSITHATVSDYEQGRRSVSLEYCVELCNVATQPFEAWKYLLLGHERPGAAMCAWFKIKNASMSGAHIK